MRKGTKKVIIRGLFGVTFCGGATVIWNIEIFKDGLSLLVGFVWFYLTTKFVAWVVHLLDWEGE